MKNALTHGDTANGKITPEYSSWCNMKSRCYNDNYEKSHRYAGRDITVCDHWLESFKHFLNDMGRKPTPEHTLDRKNNNLGYSPDNCRWATQTEQQNNRGNNIFFTLNGLSLSALQWAERLGINKQTLYQRKYQGWPDKLILTIPLNQHRSASH